MGHRGLSGAEVTFMLVERTPGIVPPGYDLDALFDGDAHALDKAIYDFSRSRRDYFLVERAVEITGWCPFLTCLEPVPHSHPICNSCGAARYGNMFCNECRSHWPAHWKVPSL